MARGTDAPVVVEEDGDGVTSEAQAHWDALDAQSVPAPTDAPPSTETVTPEVSTPAEGADRGDGRDGKGRFARKGESEQEPVPPQNPSAKAPEGQQQASTPTPEATAQATPEIPPGEGDPQVTPPETQERYTVRYGGKDYEVAGAVRTASHTVIPNESMDTVTKYLGMGLKLEHERGTLHREKAQLAVEKEMFQAETGPVMEEVKNLFALTAEQQDETFAENWLRYGLELRAQMPLLRERMELAKQRQQLEIDRRINAPDPEQRAQALHQSAIQSADAHLQELKNHPTYKAMQKADWDGIATRVQRDPTAYLRRAGQRLTPTEQEAGVEPGEVYFDFDRLLDTVQDRLTVRNELVAEATRAKQEIKIATENATRMQRESVPPPPAPSPQISTPAKSTTDTGIKTREDWDKWTNPYD